MNILERIVLDKRKEVALKKDVISVKQLEKSSLFNTSTYSLANALQNSNSGIIAEHKRRSPSKSVINHNLNVLDVTIGYENAGVCGMSVLTDKKYFGGSIDDLLIARSNCSLPILRKEFIIDEYQILEAKSIGSDAILLIASILNRNEIKQFSALAKSLNLDVLLEVHNAEEIRKSIMPTIDLLGVNNRNLKTFDTNIAASKTLSHLIPDDFVKVSESGISSVDAIKELQSFGYKGYLIGESFMKTDNPGISASEFIKALEA